MPVTEWWNAPGALMRFRSNIRRRPDGCLIWTARQDKDGYGVFSVRGQGVRAHRAALAYSIQRDLRPGEQALHSCDVTSCVEPKHLRVGTIQENAADRVERGQQARGERQGLARLTETQVYEIRELIKRGMVLERIAEQYGISRPTVGQIKRRVTWTHLEER